MDLSFSEEHERFRQEVRAFLRESWPPRGEEAKLRFGEQRALFRRRCVERGYLFRNIPKRFGGAERPPDVLEEAILKQEFLAARLSHVITGIGPAMVAPTLLEEGTEEQCAELLPRTLAGEVSWCQGYSEPGSGSDLASLQSRAELQGDEWVINGHKIWTSGAHEADYMFGLFRTELDAPAHAGISFLLLDMHQPGIQARPMKQMTGAVDFNEVFFTNALTPVRWTVGQRGEGWRVSRTMLKHERNLIGDPRRLRSQLEDLVEVARRTQRHGRPALEDGGIRRRLAELDGYIAAQEYSTLRQLTASARGEQAKIASATLVNKLYGTELAKRIAELAYDLLEHDALLAPHGEEVQPLHMSKSPGGWVGNYMFSLGNAIAGGTSNIQRNIIGERVLGLPKDLRLES